MDAYNLQINQGETYSLTMNLTDVSGNPMNLSGTLVSGMMKFRYSDGEALCNLNPTINNAASGIINLSIPATETAILPITIAVYDVEIISTGSNTVTKALMGKAYINPEVTY